jgi:putative DNA primase/helicase
MKTKTVIAARNRWRPILESFGATPRMLSGQHGPCPECGGDDRFRFDDKEGRGTWFCNTCDPQAGDGMDLVRKLTGMSFHEAANAVDEFLGNHDVPEQAPAPQKDPAVRLKLIGRQSGPVVADIDPVRSYLRSRALRPCSETRVIQECDYYDAGKHVGKFPAMVHLVHDVNGKPATWHIVHLTRDGKKAPVQNVKKILPPSRPWKGGSVRFGKAAEVMGVAEGVETAMAASELYGIPVWAALNANNLAEWVPPPVAQTVYVFGDNDPTLVGQAAAYACASRLIVKYGRVVEVHIPDTQGDWNDQLIRERDAA